MTTPTTALLTSTLQQWNLRLVAGATEEPFSLDDARLHLRVDPDNDSPAAHPDDPLITALISAAREWCEAYSGLAIAAQTYEMGDTGFPAGADPILLPVAPLREVVSIRYTDPDGNVQVVDPALYSVDNFSTPGRIVLNADESWPATKTGLPNAVMIRFVSGYDHPGDSPNPWPLPQSVIAAIKLVLGTLYDNRSDPGFLDRGTLEWLPLGAKALLDSYRVRLGFA